MLYYCKFIQCVYLFSILDAKIKYYTILALKMYDDDTDEIVIDVFQKDAINDYKDIGKIADELGLHYYGLLVYKKPGLYRIVME